MNVRVSGPRALLAGVLCATAGLTQTAAAQQGSLLVKVVDANSGAPVEQAQTFIVGTTTGGITNAEGRFLFRVLPAGVRVVRVVRVGYAEQKKQLEIHSGQQAEVEFRMQQLALSIDPVVVTATGATRRIELGNAVTTLSVADKIAEMPVKTLGDLLVAKAPGVQILPANMTGAGSRVRIRGTSSLSLSNDPIYVIDGIRMTSNRSDATIGVGGTAPSRVNDISPEEIENVEIVKGPSAATLYGTDAANGVIVITTRKGRAGRSSWTFFTELGSIEDNNTYPTQYAILGHTTAAPTTPIRCFLKDVAAGSCIKDSTMALNVFEDPETTPISTGYRNLYGVQLMGGTETVRYFVSGDVENETGVFKLPQFAREYFDSVGTEVPAEWRRPNVMGKASFRTNLNMSVSPQLDLAMQSNYIRLNQRLPQVDNNVNSFWYNGTMGPGWKGAGPGYTGKGSLGQDLNGYAFSTPAEIFQSETIQNVQRFIGGSNADWRPFSWVSSRVDVGVDLANRVDEGLCRFQQCPDFGTQRLGSSRDARANLRNVTANVLTTASRQLRGWLGLKGTVGLQYHNYTDVRNNASGSQLPPGAQTPGSGTVQSASASTTLTRTLGMFVEGGADLNDRLFLTAAVRSDQNSAFGTNFQRVYYPKASLSWVLSDESFFPRPDWLNSLRLRSAVGASGVQPGPNDANRTFSVVTTNIGNVDVSGLRSSQLGNVELRPEKATEWEGGVDAQVLDSRVGVEFTYYRKTSKDALVNRTIAPSAGSSSNSELTNLGSVQNSGVEGQLTANIINLPRLSWDLVVAASRNSNKLISLGTDASGRPIPPIVGNTIRQVEGYPLNGYWQRPYTFEDANGDGIIVPGEVTVDTSFVFLGYSQPRNEVSIINTIDLFRGRFRINTLLDHKSGYRVLNSEQQFLCQQAPGCKGLTSYDATLEEQARAIAQRFTTVLSQAGYIEEVSFWRIREVSATYALSQSLAERFLRSRDVSITLSGRNLKIFTDWTGADPEQNYSQGDTQSTLLTAGPPTYFTVRVTIRN
jgi:TonB-linked SusC/RagA family outer membrane protein